VHHVSRIPYRTESSAVSAPDARNLAIALEVRARHGVTLDGTCLHCLPPGTPWPCPAFSVAARIVHQLADERFPPPVHPDWLDDD